MKRNFKFINPHREHRTEKNRNFQAGNKQIKTFKHKKEELKLKDLENGE